MEFEQRNETEIQRMAELILEVPTNGLECARAQESERLDEQQYVIEWALGDKNDEGHLIGISRGIADTSFNHQGNTLAAI